MGKPLLSGMCTGGEACCVVDGRYEMEGGELAGEELEQASLSLSLSLADENSWRLERFHFRVGIVLPERAAVGSQGQAGVKRK